MYNKVINLFEFFDLGWVPRKNPPGLSDKKVVHFPEWCTSWWNRVRQISTLKPNLQEIKFTNLPTSPISAPNLINHPILESVFSYNRLLSIEDTSPQCRAKTTRFMKQVIDCSVNYCIPSERSGENLRRERSGSDEKGEASDRVGIG